MDAPETTLVCFAVKEEANCFKRLTLNQPNVRVLITGMGRQNAERSVAAALETVRPTLIVTSGFAGGLRPDLATGAVVFSEVVPSNLGARLIQAGAQRVTFHCSERVAAKAQDKRKLREVTGADAVEMESKAICDLCANKNIVSATVRVILDTIDEDLPLDFNDVLTRDQRINGVKLAGVLLKSPAKVAGLLRLRKQSEFAANRLAQVLVSALQIAPVATPT